MEMNNINPLNLSNVVLGDKVQKSYAATGQQPQVQATIRKVIFDLAIEKPLWVFSASSSNMQGIDEFTVTQDGEELGTISRTWYRGNHSISISNPRIADKRERSSSYRTADATKAVLAVKKMFFRKNSSELVKDSRKKASEVLRSIRWDKERAIRNDEGNVRDAQLAFVIGVGNDMFMQYLKDTHNTKILKSVESVQVHTSDMLTIEAITSKFDADETALVIITNGKYLVTIGDDANIYDDQGLPDNIRGKLAMLKLVDKEHIVSGMGCRITEEVFVIVIEKQDEIQSDTGV